MEGLMEARAEVCKLEDYVFQLEMGLKSLGLYHQYLLAIFVTFTHKTLLRGIYCTCEELLKVKQPKTSREQGKALITDF